VNKKTMNTLPPAPPLQSTDAPPTDPPAYRPTDSPPPFDDITTPDLSAAAAEARIEAVLAAPFTWAGQTLHPFTPCGREPWWRFLRKALGLPPIADVADDAREFAPDATLIIWLCLHDPAQWQDAIGDYRHDHARFARIIMDWGDQNIPFDKQTEAAALALQIYNRAHLTRAIPAHSSPSSLGE
jgi:hypothetical protein